jgi:hypothetical protein
MVKWLSKQGGSTTCSAHLESGKEMPFLDFIRNRNASPQQAQKAQDPKPETAKEMYTRQAGQESAKPLSPEMKEQATRALAAMTKGTQHLEEGKPAAPESGGSPTAELQKQNQQDKAQAALSPTDASAGKTASQEEPKAPQKSAERPKNLPRTPPSWER